MPAHPLVVQATGSCISDSITVYHARAIQADSNLGGRMWEKKAAEGKPKLLKQEQQRCLVDQSACSHFS